MSALDDLLEEMRVSAENDETVCPEVVQVMVARSELLALRRDLESARYLYESRFKEIEEMRERVAALESVVAQAVTFMDHLERHAPLETTWSQPTAARTHDALRAALTAPANPTNAETQA